jgi:DNA repair protein RadC
MDREEFWVMALTTAQELIHAEMLFRGTVDCCLAHPRDVFRFAVRMNASRLLLLHNHPSGDPRPSALDWAFTEKITRCSWMMEIPIVDHVIVTERSYKSLADLRPHLFREPQRPHELR